MKEYKECINCIHIDKTDKIYIRGIDEPHYRCKKRKRYKYYISEEDYFCEDYDKKTKFEY